MKKQCEFCAFLNSDCRGNKESESVCDYYKKPNVFNAKEAAEQIERLEEENMKMAMQLKFLTSIYGKASETMIKLYAASRSKEDVLSLCEELERVIEEWKNSAENTQTLNMCLKPGKTKLNTK